MKKRMLIVFLISMFLFIGNVNAAGISCEKTTINVGDSFYCDITVDENDPLTIDTKLSASKTTISESSSVKFTANAKGKYTITIYNADKSFVDDGTKITVIEKTTTTTTTTKKTTTTTTTKGKSSNANLSKILVNGEEVENFDKDTKKYTVTVDNDVTKANIKAVSEDDNATVKVDGPNKLEIGENEFTISVTSEDQTTKNYKVIVKRSEKEATNSTKIKKIKIDGYKLDFDKNSKTFYLNIKKEDTELDITVTPVDENAKVKITGNEDLEDGSIIKIIVTTQNGDKATYRLIIEKKETNPVPFIVIGIIVLIIIGVAIFMFIQNRKEKKEKKEIKDATKNKKNDEYEESYENEEDNDEEEQTKELPVIDNDEEDKTRMFSYEEDGIDRGNTSK